VLDASRVQKHIVLIRKALVVNRFELRIVRFMDIPTLMLKMADERPYGAIDPGRRPKYS
jgi:hypothetical protein